MPALDLPRAELGGRAAVGVPTHDHGAPFIASRRLLLSSTCTRMCLQSCSAPLGHAPCAILMCWRFLASYSCLTPLGHPLGCGSGPCTLTTHCSTLACHTRRLAWRVPRFLILRATARRRRELGGGCGHGPLRARGLAYACGINAACDLPLHPTHRAIRVPLRAYNGCQSRRHLPVLYLPIP